MKGAVLRVFPTMLDARAVTYISPFLLDHFGSKLNIFGVVCRAGCYYYNMALERETRQYIGLVFCAFP